MASRDLTGIATLTAEATAKSKEGVVASSNADTNKVAGNLNGEGIATPVTKQMGTAGEMGSTYCYYIYTP